MTRFKALPRKTQVILVMVIGCLVCCCATVGLGAITSSTPSGKATATARAATQTALPTNTPRPTHTARPTKTLTPTDTPHPTNTSGPTDTPKPMNTPGPTNTPVPTSSPEQRLNSAVREALGESNRHVMRVDEVTLDTGQVYVFWAINDNLSSSWVARGAMLDMVAILKAVDETGIDFETINVAGSFSMVDAYGNVHEQVVVSLGYSKATVNRINWDNFVTDNIYLIADEVLVLHPEFRP